MQNRYLFATCSHLIQHGSRPPHSSTAIERSTPATSSVPCGTQRTSPRPSSRRAVLPHQTLLGMLIAELGHQMVWVLYHLTSCRILHSVHWESNQGCITDVHATVRCWQPQIHGYSRASGQPTTDPPTHLVHPIVYIIPLHVQGASSVDSWQPSQGPNREVSLSDIPPTALRRCWTKASCSSHCPGSRATKLQLHHSPAEVTTKSPSRGARGSPGCKARGQSISPSRRARGSPGRRGRRPTASRARCRGSKRPRRS